MRTLSALALAGAAAAAAAVPRPAALRSVGNRPAYGAAPVALDTTSLQFVLDSTIPLADDWDVYTVDLSRYGVPWGSYLYQEPLPASWEGRLANATDAALAYKLPVMLQLPINGNDKRSCPASNASDYPGTSSPQVDDFSGCTACFDYDIIRNPVASYIRQAWINYALSVALAFNATGTLAIVNLGIDANRFLESGCPAEQWTAYQEFYMQAYVTIKEAFPDKAVFPSFSLETMMQVQDGQACKGLVNFNAKKVPTLFNNCFKAGYAQLAGIPRDAFAFTSFPALATTTSGGWQPWYVTQPLALMNASDADNLVVAATGYYSTPVAVNYANGSTPIAHAASRLANLRAHAAAALAADPPVNCITIIPSSPGNASAWFDALNAAVSDKAWVVSYQTARDTLFDAAMACPCSAPLPALQPYCDALSIYRQACMAANFPAAACELSVKSIGTLGIRDLFNQPREPLYSAVQAARATPLPAVATQ